jgi:hypothetical protein
MIAFNCRCVRSFIRVVQTWSLDDDDDDDFCFSEADFVASRLLLSFGVVSSQ